MPKKLTPARAEELKAMGITHIASIIKEHYASRYYNVNSIERILENGGYQPRPVNGWAYPIGLRQNRVNWEKTIHWSEI